MRDLKLALIVHHHLPVGEFEHVHERCLAEAWDPFLAFLERRPRVRLGLHLSGPLLEWLAAGHTEHLARLRALVAREQVEPWGGGWSEPVLAAIPERDRRGQVLAMSARLEREFGRRPRGLWLPGMVWDPAVVPVLAECGVQAVALEDSHFVAAGFGRHELWGWYLTEDQGRTVAVLPARSELRHLIPFGDPVETARFLAAAGEGRDGALAVMADDGGKFGAWPGTHQRCYAEGWLDRFADALEGVEGLELVTPAEALARTPCLGLAHLPGASSRDLAALAPGSPARERYRRAAEGGPAPGPDPPHWRNALARVPEAGRMHRRMVRASLALDADPRRDRPEGHEARSRLWRAQCHDAYGHAGPQGLLQPHLREAVYAGLIAVEHFVAPEQPMLATGDLDLDGVPDALLQTPRWAAWITARGAALWAFDDRAGGRAWLDTLGFGGGGGTRPRDALLDAWHEAGAAHDWSEAAFALTPAISGCRFDAPASPAPALEKHFAPGADGALEVRYALTSERPRLGRLEVTLHLGAHVPDAEDRWFEVEGARATPPAFAAAARHAGVARFALVDAWADRRLDLWADRRGALERAPLEVAAGGPGGGERLFQGVVARLSFPAALEPGRPWALTLRLAPGRAGSPA